MARTKPQDELTPAQQQVALEGIEITCLKGPLGNRPRRVYFHAGALLELCRVGNITDLNQGIVDYINAAKSGGLDTPAALEHLLQALYCGLLWDAAEHGDTITIGMVQRAVDGSNRAVVSFIVCTALGLQVIPLDGTGDDPNADGGDSPA